MMGWFGYKIKANPSLPIFHLPSSRNLVEERFTLTEIKFCDFFYSFIKYHLWFQDFARSRRSIPSCSERPRYSISLRDHPLNSKLQVPLSTFSRLLHKHVVRSYCPYPHGRRL